MGKYAGFRLHYPINTDDYRDEFIAIQATVVRPEYFPEPSLFPTWPVFDAERALQFFGVSMAIVLAPKVFGWLAALVNLRHASDLSKLQEWLNSQETMALLAREECLKQVITLGQKRRPTEEFPQNLYPSTLFREEHHLPAKGKAHRKNLPEIYQLRSRPVPDLPRTCR